MVGNRPFMVWDGEGCGHDDQQDYVLFGWQRDGDSHYISGRSLRTSELLDFIYAEANDYIDHIHVSFGFGYDVDQILKDMPDELQRELIDRNKVAWDEWVITYLPHKMFKLKRVGKGNKEITICDAMTFFGTSLIGAAKQYVPDHPLMTEVSKGKSLRNSFTFDQLSYRIIPYWERENKLFLETMQALRQSLMGAGINVESWHGPGAVANALIKKHKLGTHIQQSRDEMPLEVTTACQFAFFGGRFENLKCGRIPGPIYGYDLRSAYPAAMSKMPGLKNGQWRKVWFNDENGRAKLYAGQFNEWGLYRYMLPPLPESLREDACRSLGPLPNRAENGTVSFAIEGNGWAFGHEIIAAALTGWDVRVLYGWVYEVPEKLVEYPFIYNLEMYIKRAQYKKAGNPAQLGLKLGMNSGYGKLAQTIGYDEETLRPPKYHHSWYAGQITSWCRARIQLAMAQAPNAIVACETDGIYSRVPLNLRIGTGLGEWEETRYDEMVYVQSGFYFARQGECPPGCPHTPKEPDSQCAWQIAKVRGLSTGKNADLGDVFDRVNNLAPIPTTVTRYGSMTGYIGRPNAHTWFDQDRTAVWGGGGKRYHEPAECMACKAKPNAGQAHDTVMTRPFCGDSAPRTLAWAEDPELDYDYE